MSYLDDVADAAIRYLGCDYVWGGNGLKVFDSQRLGLILHSWGVQVFDCVGLVNTAIAEAGGPDNRGKENANTLFHGLIADPTVDPFGYGMLLFFGEAAEPGKPAYASHIALSLGNGLTIQAAGGGARTVSPDIAKALGARVQIRREVWAGGRVRRNDFLGSRVPPKAARVV